VSSSGLKRLTLRTTFGACLQQNTAYVQIKKKGTVKKLTKDNEREIAQIVAKIEKKNLRKWGHPRRLQTNHFRFTILTSKPFFSGEWGLESACGWIDIVLKILFLSKQNRKLNKENQRLDLCLFRIRFMFLSPVDETEGKSQNPFSFCR
jgi:hypothetical protein